MESKQAEAPIRLRNIATIEWRDNAGALRGAAESPRSAPEILKRLVALVNGGDITEDDNIRVIVRAEDERRRDSDNNELALVLADGNTADTIASIEKNILSNPAVVNEFRRKVEFAASCGTLRGALITLVFENAEVGGFGYLTDIAPASETDVRALCAAATAQIDALKNKLEPVGGAYGAGHA